MEYERLFNDDNKKEIILQISVEEWNKLDQSMLDYADRFQGDLRNDQYVLADFMYTDQFGSFTVKGVSLRTRGNLSRVRIQNDQGEPQLSHFKISFKEPLYLTEDSKASKAIDKRRVLGVSELNLKWNRNWDTSYVSEKFSYDLFTKMDLLSPSITKAKFSIQIGSTLYYYGLYDVIESIDQDFLARRLGEEASKGNLYKSLWQSVGPATLIESYPPNAIGIRDVSRNYRPSYDLKTNKKANDTSDLVSFIINLNNLSGTSLKNYLEEHFEVDDYLKFLAIGVLLGNPDDYRAMGNNYYLYHNNLTGKFTMIPYDYDHGLGQGWDGWPVFTDHTIGADIYQWGNLNRQFNNPSHNSSHPLVDKILSYTEYQLRYEQYLRQLTNPSNLLFIYSVFYSEYQQQRLLYDGDLHNAMHSLRFDLRNIQDYMNRKSADIQQQLNYYNGNPGLRGT